MKVVSVNVGLPQEIEWKGERIQTGIFKSPMKGPITMRTLNFDGDRQADLTVHGGTEKAVYGYAFEHYAYWRAELNISDLPPGSFGENLTLIGLDEETVHIGDRYRIGGAEVVVTQPRIPCFKLAAKFAPTEIVKRFLESGLSGFYFAVAREGDVAEGDAVDSIYREPRGVRIADLNRLFRRETGDEVLIRRALSVEALATPWRRILADRLERAGRQP